MNWLVLGATEAPLQLSVGGGSSAVKLFLLLTVLSFATGALIAITRRWPRPDRRSRATSARSKRGNCRV
jgi:hypothetical protein